ncbi:MAG: cyclic nucleotide-binding domain-containing protein [Candidatus Lindowbacteria bacterium]|nr:cyclic nucleotide-binding domain-containing protein [Candidatus Lindowbacteria bacterium]
MNISDLLVQVPIFCTLEVEEHAILRESIEQKRYKPEEFIFEEKDPGDGLYVIAMGAVRIVKNLDGVNNRTLAGITDLDFFGEMALLDGKPRSAGAVAARDTVILKLSNENFNTLMNSNPFIAMKVITQIACHLAARFRDTNMKLAEAENYRLLREKK